MRQSGNALRKLVRSVAAEGFWSGEVKGARRDLARKTIAAGSPTRLLRQTFNGPCFAARLLTERLDLPIGTGTAGTVGPR
jgi:hypothetical protein